ncbi:unnamed protein product [Cuscuta epithymum]|uniref:Uncharacterized protein n=1 Tax=Cuscuta epithymum TaxID=186058 RepID=A0AAV0DVU4_9ASTE|nr:unnamed protein product [Cuscuta epithymum]
MYDEPPPECSFLYNRRNEGGYSTQRHSAGNRGCGHPFIQNEYTQPSYRRRSNTFRKTNEDRSISLSFRSRDRDRRYTIIRNWNRHPHSRYYEQSGFRPKYRNDANSSQLTPGHELYPKYMPRESFNDVSLSSHSQLDLGFRPPEQKCDWHTVNYRRQRYPHQAQRLTIPKSDINCRPTFSNRFDCLDFEEEI